MNEYNTHHSFLMPLRDKFIIRFLKPWKRFRIFFYLQPMQTNPTQYFISEAPMPLQYEIFQIEMHLLGTSQWHSLNIWKLKSNKATNRHIHTCYISPFLCCARCAAGVWGLYFVHISFSASYLWWFFFERNISDEMCGFHLVYMVTLIITQIHSQETTTWLLSSPSDKGAGFILPYHFISLPIYTYWPCIAQFTAITDPTCILSWL